MLLKRPAPGIDPDQAQLRKIGQSLAMHPPSHFEQLLQAAVAQPEPQRLLFVFAAAELPADATPEQRQRFEAAQGGALSPLACVDKGPEELGSFEELVQESRNASPPWQVVFVAGLAGREGRPPSAQQVDRALQTMVENVKGGSFRSYLALNPMGEALSFS
jgi:hypothetical protein